MPLGVLLLQIDRNPRLGCPAQVLELHLAQTKEGRDTRRGPPSELNPQCESTDSTSERSPDHSVWNVPALSMR